MTTHTYVWIALGVVFYLSSIALAYVRGFSSGSDFSTKMWSHVTEHVGKSLTGRHIIER